MHLSQQSFLKSDLNDSSIVKIGKNDFTMYTSTQGQHKLIWIMTAIWSANQPIRYLGMLPKGLASKFNIEKKINLTIHFQSSKTSHCKFFNRLQKCGLLLVFNSLALKIKQFIIQHSTTQQKGQYCTYQTSEFLLNNKHFPYLFPYAYYRP